MASASFDMRYELWRMDEDDGPTYTLIPDDADEQTRRVGVEPGAVLLEVIEAASWADARARQYQLLGWEPYRPHEPS